MTRIKPDERVDVGVRPDDRWRTLYREPRPPRAVEDAFAAVADRRQRNDTRDDLQKRINAVRDEISRIEQQLGRAAPGDHRGYLREIRHGLNGLAKALQ